MRMALHNLKDATARRLTWLRPKAVLETCACWLITEPPLCLSNQAGSVGSDIWFEAGQEPTISLQRIKVSRN